MPAPRATTDHRRLLALLAACLLLLACVPGVGRQAATVTDETPSWACPSPTPLPYGEAGPVKAYLRGDAKPTAVPSGPVAYEDDTPIYYERWEREYGARAPGPPFPSPTAYARNGVTFSLGQRVSVPPLFVQVSAAPGQRLGDGLQLYALEVRWTNPTTITHRFDYWTQIRLAAVLDASGREQLGTTWAMSGGALDLAGREPPPHLIPPGESAAVVPVIAAAGAAQRVELTLIRGLATPAPSTTPTPNSDLRAVGGQELTVAFVADRPAGPPCESPGATTAWDARGPGAGGVADVPVGAPPGARRIVQLALAQVGKPYVWGAAGPTAFDCSGLVQWLYEQVGTPITTRGDWGTRSSTQYHSMRPVDAAEIQPGDAIYFSPRSAPGSITHAAIYVGDVRGGPAGDFVHAVSPKYGTVLQVDGLADARYRSGCSLNCIAGYRTMR